jgi:MoxR-like ATPase
MTYTPLFDPDALAAARGPRPAGTVPYLYCRDLTLAVNVALAAKRPLLLSGVPGSGKSSLARDAAWLLGRRYEEHVVTSRIRAQDLKWRFDAVRRLADAQSRGKGPRSRPDDRQYVEPGVLWRAFDLTKARAHGKRAAEPAEGAGPDKAVVVLIDEIDKADPDVPNDLLVALDARWFSVDDIDDEVRAPADLQLLMVITTNGERDLPPAFVRRCVDHRISTPSIKWMKTVARTHFPKVSQGLLDTLGVTMEEIQKRAKDAKRREPSTAEFLDALRALQKLRVNKRESKIWRDVTEATLWKAGGERSSP